VRAGGRVRRGHCGGPTICVKPFGVAVDAHSGGRMPLDDIAPVSTPRSVARALIRQSVTPQHGVEPCGTNPHGLDLRTKQVGDRAPEGHVWHCSLPAAPEDHVLTGLASLGPCCTRPASHPRAIRMAAAGWLPCVTRRTTSTGRSRPPDAHPPASRLRPGSPHQSRHTRPAPALAQHRAPARRRPAQGPASPRRADPHRGRLARPQRHPRRRRSRAGHNPATALQQAAQRRPLETPSQHLKYSSGASSASATGTRPAPAHELATHTSNPPRRSVSGHRLQTRRHHRAPAEHGESAASAAGLPAAWSHTPEGSSCYDPSTAFCWGHVAVPHSPCSGTAAWVPRYERAGAGRSHWCLIWVCTPLGGRNASSKRPSLRAPAEGAAL